MRNNISQLFQVINALPRSWVKSEGTHVFLGRLEDFLIKLSEKLDPTTHTPALKEVCDLLKSIGATAQAEKIAYKYLWAHGNGCCDGDIFLLKVKSITGVTLKNCS